MNKDLILYKNDSSTKSDTRINLITMLDCFPHKEKPDRFSIELENIKYKFKSINE